jgi:hypothetical protein
MAADSFVGDGAGEEKVEGDFTVEVLIVTAIDNTHPAAADFFIDSVVGNLFSHEGSKQSTWPGMGSSPCYSPSMANHRPPPRSIRPKVPLFQHVSCDSHRPLH